MQYRRAGALTLLSMALLAGCAASGLRDKPEPPGVGASISADYTVLADRVRVEIDTRGARLEDMQILKPDGAEIRPQTIEYPAFRTHSGMSFGVGVARGVGVVTSMPVGEPRAEGNTVAYFWLDQLGPAPWRLRAQLGGLGPAFFTLGGNEGRTKERQERRGASRASGAEAPLNPATTRLGDRHQIGAEGFCLLRDLVGGRSETYHRLDRDALKLGFRTAQGVAAAVGDALHLLALVRHDAAVVAELLLRESRHVQKPHGRPAAAGDIGDNGQNSFGVLTSIQRYQNSLWHDCTSLFRLFRGEGARDGFRTRKGVLVGIPRRPSRI